MDIIGSNVSLSCDESRLLTINAGCYRADDLTRDQVCDLIALLQYWVDHGELPRPIVEVVS